MLLGAFPFTAAAASDSSELGLSTGDYLYFGSIEGEELVWQVLDAADGQALLFCATPFLVGELDASIHEYSYTGPTYQYKYGSCSWRTSDVRTYLNSAAESVIYTSEGFDYSGFTAGIGGTYSDNNNQPSYASEPGFLSEGNFEEPELALIETTTYRTLVPYTDPEHENGDDTPQYSNYGSYGQHAAGLIDSGYAYVTLTDRMFLLSAEEYYQYLDQQCWTVDMDWSYAREQLGLSGGSYWLRDPRLYYENVFLRYLHVGLYTMGVNSNGYYLDDFGAGNESKYIRPACYISLNYVDSLTGSGTAEDPYRLEINDEVMDRTEYVQSSVYRQHPTDLTLTVYRNRKEPTSEKGNYVLCEGATIRSNAYTYRTDANGQVTIPYPRTGVTISYDGYVTREISAAKLEDSPEVYLEQKSEYPVISAVWAGNTDVLHTDYELDPINSGTHTIKTEVNWGESECGKLYLQQEGIIFSLADGKGTRLTWTDHFDVSEKIYIVAENADGLVTKLPLKIDVQTYDLSALEGYEISIGKGFNITLGENSGEFLSGTEVGFDIYSPITFKMEKEDGRVYILFGAQLNLNQSSDDQGSPIKIKQMVLSMKDLKEKLSSKITSTIDKYNAMEYYREGYGEFFGKGKGTLSVGAQFQLMGFMEGYETASGEVVFVDGGYIVGAEGSADYTVPVSIGGIPAFGGFTIKSGVNATFNTSVSPELKRFVPDGELEWDSSISLYGGVGMKGIVSVSAGIKGSLEWDLHYDEGNLNYYQLKGTVKPFVKGEAGPFTASKDFDSFVDKTLYTYPEAEDLSNITELQEQTAELLDAERYTPRQVNDSQWRTATRGSGGNTLLENASTGADPILYSLSNGTMILFFIDQNPAFSDANGQQLYYSLYDGSQWSTPELWKLSGTADAFASIAELDGVPTVAWTSFGELTESSTLASSAAGTSVMVMEQGSRSYTLSQSGKLSYAPIVVGDYVIWQGNADNDWLGTSNNIIYCAQKSGRSWGSAKTLHSGLGTIISMAADVQDGVLNVAWAMDTDGDLTTADDIEIFVNGERITDNSIPDCGVSYENHVLYWCADGKLMADGVCVLEPENAPLSDRFEIVDENGVKALVYTVSGDYTSTLYLSWCENGLWQQPVALTDGTENIFSFSCAVSREGTLVIAHGAQNVDAEAEEPFGAASLRVLTVESGCDLALTGIYTDCSSYVKNREQAFKLTVTNSGSATAEALYVEVIDANGRLIVEQYLQTSVAPGQSVEVECITPMYKAEQDQLITFRVSPANGSDRNEEDNTAEITLHWDDLALENFSWGFREDGAAVVYGGVVNRGYSAHESITVNLRKGSQDGEILDSLTIESLNSFGQAGVSFAIPDAQLDELYYITVEVDDDRNSNNYCMAVIDETLKDPEDEEEDGCDHFYFTMDWEPTCTEQGYTIHTCGNCGDTYFDNYVPALGHDWDDGIMVLEPTETGSGLMVYSCQRCGEELHETIPPTGSEDPDDPIDPDDPDDLPCSGGSDCPSVNFRDISVSDWFHDAVDYAVYHGLMNGMSDTTFEPNTSMSRAMLVTVLWRYAGEPLEGENSFTDVPDGQWYTEAVAWAAENGIVTGVGNGKFDPDGRITREQLAAILFRYSNSLGIDTSERDALGYFPDGEKVSSYAVDALSWAVAEGLVTGTQSGSKVYLDPQGNATRAQVATILMRFIENIAK